MIRHLLKLVWNRKRSNLLIAVEILLSFIVLVAVLTLVAFYVDNYRTPLGFDVANVWVVTAESNDSADHGSSTVVTGGSADQVRAADEARRIARAARVAQLLLALRDMPEVVSAAASAISPYGSSTWTSDTEIAGRRVRFGAGAATDDFPRTIGLTVTRGRWFSREDDGAQWTPVVINERLARDAFPGKDPIGQFMSETRPGDDPIERLKVVGVIADYRKDGEYSAPENFVFRRLRLDDTKAQNEPPRDLVIRVKPGTTAEFEARAVERLRAAAPDWTFQAEALVQSRDTALTLWLAPLSAAAVVSIFLLLMVAMGLTGVLWMHVTQRTREIGLRRAKGATAADIRRQLVGEVALLTTIAVLLGVALVVQVPILDAFSGVRPAVYGAGIVAALACIYTLTLVCAWMPSRIASAVHPAEALRYE